MTIAHKISKFNRERKWEMFKKQFPFNDTTKLLDVGFNNVEHSEIDNYLEKVYPYPERITALGITTGELFQKRYPSVKTVTYEGDYFPFDHQSFDIVCSNAVVEHVGNRNKQLLFLKEIKRVGKSAFITTPNKYFPVEVHTRTILLHFLPQKIFYRYLNFIGKKWATGDYMNLLSENMIIKLLRDAGIEKYKIKRNRLFVFTLDFIIIF
ncbi:MAG: methyltransferase domain-containing protein [Ginsengibacter sp.]